VLVRNVICLAKHWWLTYVILATQEVEIRRISVQSQPGQIVQETLPQKTLHKKSLLEIDLEYWGVMREMTQL
jgi:hypothetical protein